MKTRTIRPAVRLEMPEEVVQSMEHIIDYLWDDESRNYRITEDSQRQSHIFAHLVVVQRWLLARPPTVSPSGRKGPTEANGPIDVSAAASEQGIPFPTAFTRRAWKRCLRMPGVDGSYDQDARLASILSEIAMALPGGGWVRQACHCCVTVPRTPGRLKPVNLKCVLGPDGEGLPVLTVMLPDED
jgi:hypothetical protein